MLKRVVCAVSSGYHTLVVAKTTQHCPWNRKSVPTTVTENVITGQRNVFTSEKSILHPCYLQFFDYLKIMEEKVSAEKFSWPPLLLEFFGNCPISAIQHLQMVVQSIQQLHEASKNSEELGNLIDESISMKSHSEREDLLAIAESEKLQLTKEIESLEKKILNDLASFLQGTETSSEVALEISAGAGGQEAMLFAAEIFQMYRLFCLNYGQEFEVIDLKKSDIGGYENAVAHVYFSDLRFFQMFLNEGGVHRVQRVPATERTGRIHTSTISVAILPVYNKEEMIIPEKDLEITRFRKSNSPGGQHANKVQTAIRIKHIPSGRIVQNCATKSVDKNHELALAVITAKLYQEKLDKQRSELGNARRQQVKNRERSDKIRTYNFNQDRITDHRIGYSVVNVKKFLNGEELLYNLMEKLAEKLKMEELDVSIKTLLDERNRILKDVDS